MASIPQPGECVYVASWWDPEAAQTLQRRYLKHVAVVERIIKASSTAGPRKQSGRAIKKDGKIKLALRYFYRPHQTFHPPSHPFYEKVCTYPIAHSLLEQL